MSEEKDDDFVSENEELDTIEKIRKQIPENDNFIFRGENRENDKISSTLYRQQTESIAENEDITDENKDEVIENFHFPVCEKEIIEKAKKHFPTNTTNLKILTKLQHYEGKTTLIDFTKNFLIALFFACDGENKNEDGYLYLLNTSKTKKIKEIYNKDKNYDEIYDEIYKRNPNEILLLESNSKNNRPIFQSSVFVHSPKAYLDKKIDEDLYKTIKIKGSHKQDILKELNIYHNINTETIYNDIQGFITNSKNYETSQNYFYIGLSFQKKENYKEAIKNYTKAIELNPNFVEAYNNRGIAKDDLGKHEEAIKDYTKAIELNPNLAEAYSNRGLAKNGLEKYDEAVENYTKAIELNPNLAEAYYNRGFAKDDLGKHEEAIKNYTKAIELNPNLAEAYSNRGIAKDDLGKHEEAIKDCTKAIELNPNLAEAYYNRGFAKNGLEKYDEAIKDCTKAIELNPNFAMAYSNRGIAKIGLGKYEAAIEDFTKAIELNPNLAEAYYNRGIAKNNLGDNIGAIEDFTKAIELNPNFAEAYYNRGVAKIGLEKYGEAIEDFTKAIELNPNLAEAYSNRGAAQKVV